MSVDKYVEQIGDYIEVLKKTKGSVLVELISNVAEENRYQLLPLWQGVLAGTEKNILIADWLVRSANKQEGIELVDEYQARGDE